MGSSSKIILAGLQNRPAQGSSAKQTKEKIPAKHIRPVIGRGRTVGNRRAAEKSIGAVHEILVGNSVLSVGQCRVVKLRAVTAFGCNHRSAPDLSCDERRVERRRVALGAAGRLAEVLWRCGVSMTVKKM